jgi:hypothetical protein
VIDEQPQEQTEARHNRPLAGYYTQTQMLQSTGWQRWTLARHVKENGLPILRIGRYKYYPIEGVDAWFQQFLNTA